jgi:hypothetical protein
MTRRQLDLYAECNLGQAPEELFRSECCSRCVNPDCTRSMYGKTHFEDRVQNWHERLFTKVPRMLPDDERFGKIAGQRFLLIDPVSPGTASAWVDPRDLEAKPMIQVPRSLPAAVSTPVPPPVAVAPEPVAQPEPPQPPAPQEPLAPRTQLATTNTPVKKGQMLGGKSAPAKDWDTPPPALSHPVPDAQVVKTGAKIKIGS